MTAANTPNTNASTNALDDAELQEIAGGSRSDESTIYDKQGREIGYYAVTFVITDHIYYWQCSHCGGPVHASGSFYFCDKCDDWWLSRAPHRWYGTKEELIAAAN